MIVIRTAEALARALDSPLAPEAKDRLACHGERLAEYDDYTLDELAMFAVVQPGDPLADIECALDMRLVADGDLAMTPELIERYSHWIETTFILSDDGFGLILLVEDGPATNATLLEACRKHLQHDNNPTND